MGAPARPAKLKLLTGRRLRVTFQDQLGELGEIPIACHAIRSMSRGPPTPCSAPNQPCSTSGRDKAPWCDVSLRVGSLLTTC
jgi:hypothetical protein